MEPARDHCFGCDLRIICEDWTFAVRRACTSKRDQRNTREMRGHRKRRKARGGRKKYKPCNTTCSSDDFSSSATKRFNCSERQRKSIQSRALGSAQNARSEGGASYEEHGLRGVEIDHARGLLLIATYKYRHSLHSNLKGDGQRALVRRGVTGSAKSNQMLSTKQQS
jgi:hypothetical protein